MTPAQRETLHRIADLSLGHSKPLTKEQEAVKERVLDYALMEDAPCFCGAMKGWDHETVDRHGFQMTLRLCDSCGLLRTNPRPTEQTLARYYAEDYRELYGSTPEALWQRQCQIGEEVSGLLYVGELDAFTTVYDIGCGAGGVLYPLWSTGRVTVDGCDYDSEHLSYGGTAFGSDPDWELHEGGAEQLADGGADLVIALHTLEHRADLREALEQHREKLKPGGQMLVGVPTLETIRTHYAENVVMNWSWPHLWHFTARSLKRVLECCGFDAECTWDGMAICETRSLYESTPPQCDRTEAARTMGVLMEAQP